MFQNGWTIEQIINLFLLARHVGDKIMMMMTILDSWNALLYLATELYFEFAQEL